MEHARQAIANAKKHKNATKSLKIAKKRAKQRAKATTKTADIAEAALKMAEEETSNIKAD